MRLGLGLGLGLGLSAQLALIGWACSSALQARVLAQCSAPMRERSSLRCDPPCPPCPAKEAPPWLPAPLCLLAGLGAMRPLLSPLLVPVLIPVLE